MAGMRLTGSANASAAWLLVNKRGDWALQLPVLLLLLLEVAGSKLLHHCCCRGSHPDTAPSSGKGNTAVIRNCEEPQSPGPQGS